jgi:hypothetical protein
VAQGTVASAVLTIREMVHSTGSSRFRRRWLSWFRTVITSIGTTMIRISAPTSRMLCGTRVSVELATTSSKVARVSAARAGRNLLPLRIRSRLMETATKSRPVRAAAAVMIALKTAPSQPGYSPASHVLS